MARKCGNCKATIGCSCKIRKATDGKSCCASCVAAYNNKIKVLNRPKNAVKNAVDNTTPVLISATAKQKE